MTIAAFIQFYFAHQFLCGFAFGSASFGALLYALGWSRGRVSLMNSLLDLRRDRADQEQDRGDYPHIDLAWGKQ